MASLYLFAGFQQCAAGDELLFNIVFFGVYSVILLSLYIFVIAPVKDNEGNPVRRRLLGRIGIAITILLAGVVMTFIAGAMILGFCNATPGAGGIMMLIFFGTPVAMTLFLAIKNSLKS